MKVRNSILFSQPTRSLLLLVALSVTLFSCSKDPIREVPVDPEPVDTTVKSYDDGIFVINEGNFNWGNASVTFIDKKSGKAVQDIFTRANERSLGDVAQSMKINKDKGLIVVNNSNRVEVVSLKDFKSIRSITGFSSPRYLEVVDSGKAYVTNLQKDISVVDLNTNTIVRTIPTQNWTESMIRYDRFMFVTCIGNFNEPNNKRKAQILIVDTKLDQIVDSIETGKEPMGIVIDKKLKIWVLCSGGYDNFEPASLLRINPETRTVEKAFVFPGVKDVPSRLCINPAGDEMYYLMGGVYKVPVTAAELPTQEFIPSDGRLLYGLAVNPQNGNLFVSDAVDYVQEGKVYQYNGATGILIKSYNAGRIPGSFCFTTAAD